MMDSVTERMFSRLVGLWHESDTDKPIYEWMGLTSEEYGAIVTCEPMTAAIDQAVASFNGGIVRLDDSANPRGFVDRYMPREAMRRAITPVIIAERERCARVNYEALKAQMEAQADDTTPSSIQREKGLVWLEGWFDMKAALRAIAEPSLVELADTAKYAQHGREG